eukprot:1355075-Amorphochlora_amoeboformis.AAC.1
MSGDNQLRARSCYSLNEGKNVLKHAQDPEPELTNGYSNANLLLYFYPTHERVCFTRCSTSKNARPPRVAKRASYASSREQSRGCRLGYSTAWIRVGRFGAGHTWLDAETEYIRPDSIAQISTAQRTPTQGPRMRASYEVIGLYAVCYILGCSLLVMYVMQLCATQSGGKRRVLLLGLGSVVVLVRSDQLLEQKALVSFFNFLSLLSPHGVGREVMQQGSWHTREGEVVSYVFGV